MMRLNATSWRTFASLLILALTVIACASTTPTAAPTAPPQPAALPTAQATEQLASATSTPVQLAPTTPTEPPTPGPTGPPPSELTVQREIVFGSGSFDLPDTTAGLADLSGYKATLAMTFDGTRDGKTERWSKTYVMLVSKNPAARQLTIDRTENGGKLDAVFMAEINGTAYERSGASDCAASAIQQGNSLGDQLEPALFLKSAIGADEAGNGTVNNLETMHYTFDERALGQQGLSQSVGELWVASSGGYLVKYLLTTKGKGDYFGQGIEGTLTWDYELTDANQPVTIQLPADCPAGMVNAPLLADASNVEQSPGVLSYDTLSSVADAAAFYQKQIPAIGWKAQSAPILKQSAAVLEYVQGNQLLRILINAEADVTTVNIILERVQE